MGVIDETTGTTLAEASCFPGWAVFPVPSAIVADLPLRTSEAAKEILARAIALCRPRRPGFVFGSLDDEELQVLAADCRTLIAQHAINSDMAGQLNDDERSFDRFFGVARHDSPDAFAIGIVWGLIAMLHEVNRPHALISTELTALMAGFYRLAEAFLPAIAGERTFVASANDAPVPHEAAIERWRNGHLTFIALTGGLIFAHVRAISAIESRNNAEAIAALRDASCLFAASAAAMHLTGDLTPEDYEGIRVLMSPPHTPEGFSGLFNADHRRLMSATKRLGTLLNQEWEEIAWAREEYWLGLSGAYSAHRWVCQQLVNEAPSLMTSSRSFESRSSEQPAPEKLEAFARRALKFSGYVKPSSNTVGEILASRRSRAAFNPIK